MKYDLSLLNGSRSAPVHGAAPRLALARASSALGRDGAPELARDAVGDADRRRAEARTLNAAPGLSEAYLREICEGAANAVGRSKVSLFQQFDFARELSSVQLVDAGAVLNEMLLNALQHSHPGGVAYVIEVWCRYSADGVLDLQVTDDGVGLPEGFDPVADAGFGHTLIRALAEEMGGTAAFVSGPLGVVSRLRVPAPS